MSLPKGETTTVFFGYQKNDTTYGWFKETGKLVFDFLVQDTHDFRLSRYDPAHALVSAVQASADTFQIGFPHGDSVAFEFINRDTSAGRAIQFHLDRIYWHDTTETP